MSGCGGAEAPPFPLLGEKSRLGKNLAAKRHGGQPPSEGDLPVAAQHTVAVGLVYTFDPRDAP